MIASDISHSFCFILCHLFWVGEGMIKLLGCEESISNQYTLLTAVERGEGRLEYLFWNQPAKFEKAVGLKPQRNLEAHVS